ncbi:alpha/beta fold hydrolase [Candidatus Solirubrobacter pratensis]|uniref:alpha/beta fold hydrolase n=1 Tax=Candidatus Solirubrobacter pratensis TaxID=1298857 RepID=UPI0018C97737|nr:alpha/beta fold hydrolase [Candidatus Solirubrobacter pratensis]
MPAPPTLRALVERYDPETFEPARREARVRLAVDGEDAFDAILSDGHARLDAAAGEPDATLTADGETWAAIAGDLRGGMAAFQAGRLSVRRDLHLGVGFLAATSGASEQGRLRFRTLATRRLAISAMEAGQGPAVLALHGLGATKGSLLPTLAALADHFRVVAIDLPGFGDSDKPIGASYDPRFFARTVVDVLDALELERAHLIGNSLGGRIALEVGLQSPERVDRLALLAPSLAWRRNRPWAPLLRLVRPELGLLQPAPRPVVEAIVRRLIPGAADGWAAAGVDEFLRAYLTPAGRAAFYAAARHIYLEEPLGDGGFWPRLRTLNPPALFVWGRRDRIVPLAFARHVTDALPGARHVELDCGHVPQVERPRQTHDAVSQFLGGD